MSKIKKGDIVSHKSYSSNFFFTVNSIFNTSTSTKASLTSLKQRFNTIVNANDLSIIKPFIDEYIPKTISGKILHLDGDKKYSKQAQKYYLNNNLTSIVRNIPENKQPVLLKKLLDIYSPDILILTGHDSMIRNGINFNDIYNYKSSKFFIESVKIARKYEKDHKKNFSIFAGACQSHFEAIMSAGANFASSPARILIDFLDPLVIAKKIALTDKRTFISIEDVYKDIRDGKKGINGTGSYGKMSTIY